LLPAGFLLRFMLQGSLRNPDDCMALMRLLQSRDASRWQFVEAKALPPFRFAVDDSGTVRLSSAAYAFLKEQSGQKGDRSQAESELK
jgi:hypothetical protein